MINKINLDLARSFVQERPQVVTTILEQQNPSNVANFLKFISKSDRKIICELLLPAYVAQLTNFVSNAFFATIIDDLDISEKISILRCLEPSKCNAVLAKLRSTEQGYLTSILTYQSFEVGAWMNARSLFIPVDYQVKEAINRISNTQEEFLHNPIFIIDRDRTIHGKLNVFDLLKAKNSLPITSLMEECYDKLPDTMKLETAITHPTWRTEDILPVTNLEDKVVGILLYKDLLEGLDILEYDAQGSKDDNVISEILTTYGNIVEDVAISIFTEDSKTNE